MPTSQSPLPKLLLLGDAGVGKSALVQVVTRRGGRSSSIKSIRPTIAPDRVVVDVGPIADDAERTEVQLCDRPGSHMRPTVLKRFYDGCSGALLVYDVTNAASLDNTRKWLSELREHTAQSCPVILVGNKTDLTEARASAVAADLVEELQLTSHLKVSAMHGTGVAAAFTALTEAVLGIRPGQQAELEPEPEPEPEPDPEPEPGPEPQPTPTPGPEAAEVPTQSMALEREPENIRSSFRSVFRRRSTSQKDEPVNSSSTILELTDPQTPVESLVVSAPTAQSSADLVRQGTPELATPEARSPPYSPPSVAEDSSHHAKQPAAGSSVDAAGAAPTARSPSPLVTVRVKKRSATAHVSSVAEPGSREERHAAAIELAEAKRQRQQERDARIAILEQEKASRTALRKQRILAAQSSAQPFRVASQIPRHRSPQPHKARDNVHGNARSPARERVAFGSASPSGRLVDDDALAAATNAGGSAPRDHSLSRQYADTRGRARSTTPTKGNMQEHRSHTNPEREYRIARLSTPTRRKPLPDDSVNQTIGNRGARSRSTPSSRHRSKSPSPSAKLAFGSKPPAKDLRPTAQVSAHPREIQRKQLKKEIGAEPMAQKMLGIWKNEVRLLSRSA